MRYQGYTRGEDGLWRKRVEFPDTSETLVRNAAGRLVRVEYRGHPKRRRFLLCAK